MKKKKEKQTEHKNEEDMDFCILTFVNCSLLVVCVRARA